MNVEEFVKETLLQVLRGVRDAKSIAKADGDLGDVALRSSDEQLVKFDIAIVASEGSERSGGIQVAGIGGTAKGASHEESTSRIQFSVPIRLP